MRLEELKMKKPKRRKAREWILYVDRYDIIYCEDGGGLSPILVREVLKRRKK